MKMKQLMAAALMALLGVFGASADSVSYLDWDGEKMTNAWCSAYEIVSNQTAFAAGKTYVVNDDVTNAAQIVVQGTAANPTKLVLCDDTELIAEKGIVVNEGSALIIYGQYECTGLLVAKGEFNCAGIGSSGQDFKNCGSITINGGIISATGEGGAAGIGGGDSLGCGSVTINGGIVEAQGGYNGGKYGMAIGDGEGNTEDECELALGTTFVVYAGTNALTSTNVEMSAYLADHSAPYAKLLYVHEHVWKAPEADDYACVAWCINETSCSRDRRCAFWLGADGFGEDSDIVKEYDGTPFTMELFGLDNFTNTTGFAVSNVVVTYFKNDGLLPGAPSDPGTYEAVAALFCDGQEMTLLREFKITLKGGDVTMPKGADGSTGLLKAPGTATWKAKPYPGYVFAGWKWKGDSDNCPEAFEDLSANEKKNPTLKLKLVAGDEVRPTSFRAEWALISEDGDMWLNGGGGDVPLVFNSRSQVTATVKGLPKGLKFDKKTLRIDVSGAVADGTNDVIVTAKNASGYQNKGATLRIFVEGGTIVGTTVLSKQDAAGFPVSVWGDANGTAKTSKVYVPAYDKKGNPKTKASISAKPNKDYVFAGWYTDAGYNDPAWWLDKGYQSASQSIPLTTNLVAEGKLELFAKFIGKAVYDKTTDTWIGDDVVTDVAFTGWAGEDLKPGETNTWYQGVEVPEKQVGIASFNSQTACSISVSGLPSGVKFDKDYLCFTGAPTKAGTFMVTFTFKNASGPQKFVQMVEVEELPCWAVGTFDGYHVVETNKAVGTFTATIGKTGKVSGKTVGGDADTKFRAPYFSEVYSEDGTNLIYVLDTEVKYKDSVTKKTVTTNSTLYLMMDQDTGIGCLGGGDTDGCGVVAYQNAWKNPCVPAPQFPKAGIEVEGLPKGTDYDLALMIGAKGVVKVAGTVGPKESQVRVSAKSQLLLTGFGVDSSTNDFYYAQVCVYVPKAKFCQVYDIKLTTDSGLMVVKAEVVQAEVKPTFSAYLMPGSDRRYELADFSAEGQVLVGRVVLRELAFPIVMSSPHLQPAILIVIVIYIDEYGMQQQTMAPVAADGTFQASLAEGSTLVGIKVCEETEAL